MVLPGTAGLMVHQVYVLAVRIDLTHSLQETHCLHIIHCKTHRARVYDKGDEGSGGATSTSYYLKYKKKANSRGRKKANGWVDLDLPTGEKCSWWRLDGYATCAEPEACEELGAEPEDMELSLSNSEDSDDSE